MNKDFPAPFLNTFIGRLDFFRQKNQGSKAFLKKEIGIEAVVMPYQ
ncbi:MAG: hypothetical protein JW774_03750 [Candidatus Aureabacteria bacterium]|nr:hypothetical protein [Candidatus Auribacterota bacterium]